jgi:predicted phage tail protein
VDVGAKNTTYPVPASFGIVTQQGQAPQPPVALLEKPLFLPFDEQQTLVSLDSSDQTSPTIKHSPIVITWQAINTVSQYQLNILTDLNKNEQAEQLIQERRVTENKVSLTNLALGCYQLSLRAIDKLGLHGLAARKRLCLIGQLNQPLLKTTSIEGSHPQQANITWAEVSDALTYRIEVSESADFSTLIHHAEINDTRYHFDRESELFFRVQALGMNDRHSKFSLPLHWKPQKEVEVVTETEYWPVYLQIGLFLLALL